MQQAQGISGEIFCSCRNHTAGKSAYGRHVHPGRDTMGRKALQTCHNLYSGVKADLLIQRKHWNMKGYDEVQVEISELENIQVFLDQSTAEIFVNNGEKVFTFKAFFTDEKGIEIESEQTIL